MGRRKREREQKYKNIAHTSTLSLFGVVEVINARDYRWMSAPRSLCCAVCLLTQPQLLPHNNVSIRMDEIVIDTFIFRKCVCCVCWLRHKSNPKPIVSPLFTHTQTHKHTQFASVSRSFAEWWQSRWMVKSVHQSSALHLQGHTRRQTNKMVLFDYEDTMHIFVQHIQSFQIEP